jgi:RNA polymerase sigma-70 factor (ECF subfamily)
MEAARTSETWSGLAEMRPVVRHFLAQRCRDENEAEDIAQETLLLASRYRGSLADPDRLRPWLLRIAVNLLRDHVRRERRLPRVEADQELFERLEGREEVPGESREDARVDLDGSIVEKPRAILHLCDAKDELRARDRTLLDARYEDGRSCRETAVVCEIPPNLVKVRLFRARKRLQRVLRSRLRAEAEPASLELDRGARCVAACETTNGGTRWMLP